MYSILMILLNKENSCMSKYNINMLYNTLGSARSGTSWVSENLAKPYRYRMLFEP